MKPILFVFTLMALAFSYERHVIPRIITEKGIGTAVIAESNLKEVKKEFPNGKITKHTWGGKKVKTYVRLLNGKRVFTERKLPKQVSKTYSLSKLGISFYFNFNDELSSITITGKNYFKTDKGIVAGVSNFMDFEAAYGKSSWLRDLSEGTLSKTHKNIHFYSAKTDSTTIPSDSLIIDKIRVMIN